MAIYKLKYYHLILKLTTVSASNFPFYCILISKNHIDGNNVKNVSIVTKSNKEKLIFFCFFVDSIDNEHLLVNPDVIHPNEVVDVEFLFIDVKQKIESVQFHPKFRSSLIGSPIYPNAKVFFSYHGRVYSYLNETENVGFISDTTQFITNNKISLDEITELPIENGISQKIIKMIMHRKQITTKSVLIVGSSGSGKTYFVKHTIKNISSCVSLDLLRFLSDLESSSFDYIESVLDIEDGVLLIDDICSLPLQAATILVEKLSVLDDKPVIIIGTSRYPPYSLPIPLQAQFPYSLAISSLKHEERRKIIMDGISNSNIPEEDFLKFAVRETSGSTRGELNNLVRIISNMKEITKKSLHDVLKAISISEKTHQMKTNESIVRVGGYHKEIDEIRLFLRVCFSEDEARASLLQFSGIMLTGKSGNGKSLIIKALSQEFEVPFFVINFDKIFSRYLGESERAIREVFASARFFAPCAVVIEDIDAIGAKRSDESGVGGRVLSTLLNEIDGIDKKAKVLLIATTNAPEIVDSALMRPGRFDRIIEIGMPTQEDRIEIFNILREMTPVSNDVTSEWLASITNNYTCAELQSFFRFSALQALREGKDEVTSEYFSLGQQRVQERKSSYENASKSRM